MKVWKSKPYPTREQAEKSIPFFNARAKKVRNKNNWVCPLNGTKYWVDSQFRIVIDYGKVKKHV